MPTMRNKAKSGIDKAARSTRKATDKVVETGDQKIKQASSSMKKAGRRAKNKTKSRT